MRRIFSNKIVIVALIIVVLLILVIVSHNERSGVNSVSNIISIPAAPLQKAFSFVKEKVGDFSATLKTVGKSGQKMPSLDKESVNLSRRY